MTRDSGIVLKNQIELYRRAFNMSRTDLARAINRSFKNICMIEDGKTVPSLDIAWKLAQIFGVSITDIFYEEGCEAPASLKIVKRES